MRGGDNLYQGHPSGSLSRRVRLVLWRVSSINGSPFLYCRLTPQEFLVHAPQTRNYWFLVYCLLQLSWFVAKLVSGLSGGLGFFVTLLKMFLHRLLVFIKHHVMWPLL